MQKKYSHTDYLKYKENHSRYCKNYKAKSEKYKKQHNEKEKMRYHFKKEQALLRAILLI